MLCPSCDTSNETGARFCRVCGTAFAAPASGAPARVESPRPVYTFTNTPVTGPACPSCARPNPVGAKYCVYCASAMQGEAISTFQPVYATQLSFAGPQPNVALTFSANDAIHLMLRAIWFFFIGWWLGLMWSFCAWLFNLTLIGLPVGLMMLNATPTVTTLQSRHRLPRITRRLGGPEHPLLLRAIWFVLIGWWASFIWLFVAWAFSLTVLLMPISFWMWNRIPTITTLAAEQ